MTPEIAHLRGRDRGNDDRTDEERDVGIRVWLALVLRSLSRLFFLVTRMNRMFLQETCLFPLIIVTRGLPNGCYVQGIIAAIDMVYLERCGCLVLLLGTLIL